MTYIPDWTEDTETKSYFTCKSCGVGISHIGYCGDCAYEIQREEEPTDN